MTGFAASEVEAGPHKLAWELRSVNHRYLDVGFRLPEELRSLEPELRRRAGERLARGKVDCSLRIVAAAKDSASVRIDAAALAGLRKLEQQVLEAAPEAKPLSVADILRWTGIVADEPAALDGLAAPALAAFSDALDALRSARQSEGERLAAMLIERLDGITGLMTGIDARLDDAAPRYRDRLRERLEKLDIEADPERLETELALIAQRADVAEEADRIGAHVSEIRDVLGRAEPVGRRLDFLIQELNREANTLASKVQDDELARFAVDLKVLIEQMREQVQNLE